MKEKPEKGTCVQIPVSMLEYVEGGNTIWIHSNLGITVLRISTLTSGKVRSKLCKQSPGSHADLIVSGDINMCLGPDAEY